jgi:ribosomal protein L44E
VYLNFDKDMASNLFGYRHRFVKEEMKDFGGRGRPRTHNFVKVEKKTDADTVEEDDGSLDE